MTGHEAKDAANAVIDTLAYSRMAIVFQRLAIWIASVALIPLTAWFYTIDVQNIHQEEKIENIITILTTATSNQVQARLVREAMLATDARIIATQEQQWDAIKRVLDSLQSQLNRLDDKIDRVSALYGKP